MCFSPLSIQSKQWLIILFWIIWLKSFAIAGLRSPSSKVSFILNRWISTSNRSTQLRHPDIRNLIRNTWIVGYSDFVNSLRLWERVFIFGKLRSAFLPITHPFPNIWKFVLEIRRIRVLVVWHSITSWVNRLNELRLHNFAVSSKIIPIKSTNSTLKFQLCAFLRLFLVLLNFQILSQLHNLVIHLLCCIFFLQQEKVCTILSVQSPLDIHTES